MLHLQGSLQIVFDALYDLGVIEPVLHMDWKGSLEEIAEGSPELVQAVHIVNRCKDDRKRLATELRGLDAKTLQFLAMEVAREYADFHSRQVLH